MNSGLTLSQNQNHLRHNAEFKNNSYKSDTVTKNTKIHSKKNNKNLQNVFTENYENNGISKSLEYYTVYAL